MIVRLRSAAPFVYTTLCCALVLSGCVTAKIESQRDSSFDKDISRVYVHSTFGMEDQELAAKFSNAILHEFSTLGITTRTAESDPLALEEQDVVAEAIAEFAPTVVLMLNQTERGTSVTPGAPGAPGTMSSEAVYDASLYDAETMRRVWRAQVSTSGDANLTTADGTAKKLAATIAKRMQEDGLIG